MIDQTFGHYRVIKKLSEGGWGHVYLAHDERLDRSVALKVLSVGTLANEAARKRFRKEALTLAKLNHPNIEGVFDFDSQDGIDFLVVEYVSGGTLASRITAAAFTEKELATMGEQIAAALEDAHERGIIHRDLKSANIAITPKGQLKVLDFGLAKLFDPASGPLRAQTLTQSMDEQVGVGTLPYMAPEQLRGDHVDLRADIYSLGVVLYEMATRQRPFREESFTRLLEFILHQPVVPPRALNAQLSPEMERIICKCLEKDPENRYQSAKEIGVDLRRLAAPGSNYSTPVAVARPLAKPRKWLIPAVIALAAAAVVGFVIGGLGVRLPFFPQKSPAIRSIAVLPLQNLSHEQDQDYFVDGMTDELITSLAGISGLRVISRTSVMHYKGTQKSLPEIANELHVDAVVEGSVMRDGNHLRVTAQLISAPTDTHLWAQSYRRDVQDVLAVQDEVAHAIAGEIKVKLTPREQVRLAKTYTANFAAHDAYLKGRYLLRQGSEDRMREARGYFEEAIKADPNYAPAYVGLAGYYLLTNEFAPGVAMPKATAFAQKALTLDDTLPDAHATLASIKFYGDWDWSGAESEFKRAIELSPSFAEAHSNYSDFLSEMGRHEEALKEIHAAERLDPLSTSTVLGSAWAYYYARQYDRAIEPCQKILEVDPHSSLALDCSGSVHLATRDYDRAITEFSAAAAASGNDPLRLTSLGCAFASAGKKAEVQRVLQQLNAASKGQYVPPYFFSAIAASSGDKDKAFQWLSKAYDGRDSYLVRLKVDPLMDPLRSDPRFDALLQRMKL